MQKRSHAAAIRSALRLRLSLISAVRLSSPLRTTPRQSLSIEARTWSESSDGLTVTQGCFSPPCISCSVLASGEGGVTRWPGCQYCPSHYLNGSTQHRHDRGTGTEGSVARANADLWNVDSPFLYSRPHTLPETLNSPGLSPPSDCLPADAPAPDKNLSLVRVTL